MYRYLNAFYKSNFFDSLPVFLAKKIFKIFKVFFVETNLKSLPQNNHPGSLDYEIQKQIVQNFSNKSFKPFNSCSDLLEILHQKSTDEKEIKFYDFGANNIDNYLYLSSKLKKIKYFYYDKSNFNDIVNKTIRENNLKNIFVDQDFKLDKSDLDFVFFGSSLQYLKNYKNILNQFIKNQTKCFIFSLTPFYDSDFKTQDVIIKQINLHPIINYAFLINYKNFIDFMLLNNYKLESKKKNNLIKFLNFDNFDKSYKFVDVLDLVFIKS